MDHKFWMQPHLRTQTNKTKRFTTSQARIMTMILFVSIFFSHPLNLVSFFEEYLSSSFTVSDENRDGMHANTQPRTFKWA